MISLRHIRPLLLLSLVIPILTQCSPHAGKSLLHFFFDGVPETDSTVIADKELSEPDADTAAFALEKLAHIDPEEMLHYPYGERECAMCHDERSLGNMVEPQPGLCYLCHEDLAQSYNYLHGPVAGGYCTACHDPHRSKNPHLLRLSGETLCFYCHRQASVLKNEMHQDLEGMECLDCHNAHGGDDKFIFQ
jgi:predicted CXXCH cytochrome family protein